MFSQDRGGSKDDNRVASKTTKRGRRAEWKALKRQMDHAGFTAFEVLEQSAIADGKGVSRVKAISPVTGIHSLEWAAATKPQRGFLSLPIEMRKQIYGHIFSDFKITNPRQLGSGYTLINNESEMKAIRLYNTLTTASRQLYVDIVGGGWLYMHSIFGFNTPESMRKYLESINPAHRDAISTIHLSIVVSDTSVCIPTTMLPLLGSLPNLNYLMLTFRFSSSACIQELQGGYGPGPFIGRRSLLSYYVRTSAVSRLGLATWHDLKGLKRCDVRFEKNPVLLFGDIFYGNDRSLVKSAAKVKSIMTREDQILLVRRRITMESLCYV